jgi:molybdate/tungstate transport system substrate-binding protein
LISIRASSIQIIPLLESGAIDYCFLYLSNAMQYGVSYLELPDEINLRTVEQEDSYARVQVRFQHARFKSIGLDRWGKPIHYGLTIPKNAPNPSDAEIFVKYLLVGEGKDLVNAMWHPVYEPSYTDNIQNLPEIIINYVVEEEESP